jgi:hypothetical protein
LPAAVEDELVRFFWPGCIMHRGGALRVHSDASGGLHRRRNLQPGLGFRYCRESEGEREEGGEALGFSGGGRSSYRQRGRRFESWRGHRRSGHLAMERAPPSCLSTRGRR